MAGYLQGRVVHVDRHLTNIALNYRPSGFIADMVFPIVSVEKQADMIKTYNQADLFRVANTVRAPGTEANKISFQVSSESYFCKNYALKVPTTIEDRANADPAFVRDVERGRVQFIQDQLYLDWDARMATSLTASANVSTSYTVGSSWSDFTISTPLEDIWKALDQAEDFTGYRSNRIVFGSLAWRYFSRNKEVIDKVNKPGVSGGAMPSTREQAASLLEVDMVMVATAYRNTAQEGQAMSLDQIWGDKVLLYYCAPRPSVEVPSFGYTLRWNAPGVPNMTVERHPYDPKIKSDEIELGYYQDEKIMDKNLGSVITGVGSSQ
jgi:hypothetical protein